MSELPEPLRSSVESALSRRILRATAVSGGDINRAFSLEVEGGERVFLKFNDRAPPRLFSTEARGLAFLAEAQALRVPRVLAVSEAPPFLVLEYVASAAPRRSFDEELGRGLAALHRATPGAFGLDHDNFIGSLPQPNRPCANWPEFFRSRRLEPQLAMAVDAGRATSKMRAAFESLFARLPELVGPPEPPARLHGDLWGGNLHVGEDGGPCLIDPAAYGGHREVDLAMMRLFGGFSQRCFAAYEEAFPLAPGAPERVALYQLYPLLVHVNLFGGSYVASVERALRTLV